MMVFAKGAHAAISDLQHLRVVGAQHHGLADAQVGEGLLVAGHAHHHGLRGFAGEQLGTGQTLGQVQLGHGHAVQHVHLPGLQGGEVSRHVGAHVDVAQFVEVGRFAPVIGALGEGRLLVHRE